MANRYWVGGTNTWNTTAGTKWALTSGGVGGQTVPTSADDVFFDAASGAVTCTIAATGGGGFTKSFNCTGFTGTIAGSAGNGIINVANGNFTLSAGMTFTNTSDVIFNGTGTITTNGKTIGGLTVSGAGITVTLGDALNCSGNTTGSLTLTQGTLALGGFNVTARAFVSNNSNTRAISFGTANIALNSATAGTLILSFATATGFTYTGTGGFTRNMAATATVNFGITAGATLTNAPNLTVNAGASTLTITGNSWWKNLNFTGSTSTVAATNQNFAGNITLGGGTYTGLGGTIFASGTITCAGKTLGGASVSLTINGSGITVDLGDAFSGQSVTLTQGTFTTNNFNVTTAGFFQGSNSNTRALNMGSSTFSIGGGWAFSTSTGMTLNAGTSTISMTSASAKTFGGGGLTYYNLNQGGAGALTISGSNTFNNITNSVQPSTVTFTAGTTQTVSNFSLAGTAGNLVTINSATPGSQFTLSKSSGTVNAQYLSIQDSNAIGGAAWTAFQANGNVDGGRNAGWNFGTGGAFEVFMMFP